MIAVPTNVGFDSVVTIRVLEKWMSSCGSRSINSPFRSNRTSRIVVACERIQLKTTCTIKCVNIWILRRCWSGLWYCETISTDNINSDGATISYLTSFEFWFNPEVYCFIIGSWVQVVVGWWLAIAWNNFNSTCPSSVVWLDNSVGV